MKKRILVVDDNKMNLLMLTDILEEEGYEVFTLLDSQKVEETAILVKPDAILLDIVMPKKDGFEICSSLKKMEETNKIPVIMVTAMTEAKLLRKAFDLGAFDYIKKPFDQIEVVARLKSAIRYHEQQKKLESLAMRDGLTNLYNHRMVIELLEKEYAKSNRKQTPIAFLMFDIDHFKKVNDTYGHKGGDAVIRGIGELLLESVRESDIVGRYGGEEFCLTLSELSFDNVLLLAKRLREAIEMHEFVEGNKVMKITTSIGIAYKNPSSNIGYNDLILIADKKLYEAKRNGRNQVVYEILD